MAVTIKGSGQVPVQVVSMSTATATTTSSSTFSATALTLSITPTNASNKILILVDTGFTFSTGGNPVATVYRGATNIGSSGYNSGFQTAYTGNSSIWMPVPISYLDSPATTSATTYTVYVNSQGGSITINGNGYGTLTLMEISGT